MRAGPKRAISVPPLELTDIGQLSRAAQRVAFIEEFCIVPRGHGAGDPVRLRDFQQDLVAGAFAEGIRTALVSIPRANGKTALAAMLGLAELFVGPPSAETLVVATDQRQAEITLRLARRMVELNPALSDRMHVFKDRLYLPENDASLVPLPAEPGALHGHDPSLLIVDELHVVSQEVWEAATTAAGKRAESLTLAISTPSTSPDTVMWDLVEHGRAAEDPAFYFVEYAAPEGCAADDPAAWREANPALACADPFLAEDALSAVLATTREGVFRQLRLGQWVGQADGWLPWGAWDELAVGESLHLANDAPGQHLDGARVQQLDGAQVVLGFDGSASGDSTALIGCTVAEVPHVFVVDVWHNPGDQRWRVPRAEVAGAVDTAFDTFEVAEMACDPWGWRSEIESWAARHGEDRVIEWPTNIASRMGPATDRFYQAVVTGNLTHDGDDRLSAHLAHCVAKATAHGDLVTKDRRGSPRKIDAAIGAIVALDRAAFHATKPRKSRKVLTFR